MKRLRAFLGPECCDQARAWDGQPCAIAPPLPQCPNEHCACVLVDDNALAPSPNIAVATTPAGRIVVAGPCAKCFARVLVVHSGGGGDARVFDPPRLLPPPPGWFPREHVCP